jgi:hypothetical protein
MTTAVRLADMSIPTARKNLLCVLTVLPSINVNRANAVTWTIPVPIKPNRFDIYNVSTSPILLLLSTLHRRFNMATTAKLNRTQVVFLQKLAECPKGEGKTIASISDETGMVFPTSMIGFGTREPEESPADSLYAMGMVRPEKQEETKAIKWIISALGRKQADKVRTRSVHNGNKIPHPLLDRTVIAFAKTRTYGLELYTDEDCEAIKAKLGEKYKEVSNESLRQQMCNRRKQGAFVDPSDKRRRIVEQAIRQFGKEGTIIPGLLTQGQMERLRAYERGEVEALIEDPT